MRKPAIKVLTVIFVFFAKGLFAQPTNDNCSGVITITPGSTCISATYNIKNAGNASPTGACGGATSTTTYDMWFTFQATASTQAIKLSNLGVNLTAATTYVELLSGTACGSFISLFCQNASTPLTATGLSVGSFYYLRIYVTSTPNGVGNSNKYDYDLCIQEPPANDDCSGAVTLTPASSCSNTTTSIELATATTGLPAGCQAAGTHYDVWYKFTASSTTETVTISSQGSNFGNSEIQLYSGSCGALTSLQCGTTTLTATGLTINSTYYIRVSNIGSSPSINGSFDICVTYPPPAPGNDECSNAYLLPTSTTCYNEQGTVSGATASAGIPIGSCTGTPDDDVWYKFVATKSNPTIALSSIATSLSTSGSRLQLLSGSCGALSSISCGTTSIAASGLSVGNTYFVRVYSNGSTSLSNATFRICVTDPTPAIITDSTSTLFNIDTVAKNLGYPWEVTYGPDDSLWLTESRGYRVLRVSSTRTTTQQNILPQQILKLPLGSNGNPGPVFDRSVGTWPQGGMEGLAIHPEFMTNSAKRWVYIAYVYNGTCPSSASSPCIFRSKIIRCQFYFSSDAGNPTSLPHRDTLVILDTVISNLSGSNDHNSGRLKISPVTEGPDNTYKLYYTIGDMGAGQFNNTTRTNNAQNKDTCEGKILRLNTEPDGDGVPSSSIHDFDQWRQWIPNDNPFTHSVFTSLRTPVFSYGHRNAQGLVWGNVNGTWRLYSSEHGDHSDDEVNIIQSGKNYGWPKVAGLADNNYTSTDDATDGFTFNNILANQTVTDEITWASAQPNYVNPIFDFFNWNPGQIETSNTGNIFNWPTIAPSSIDLYSSTQIPGWKNSLLVTSLKYGLFRLKLNSAGDNIDSTICTNAVDTFPLLHSWRIRDIAISPNGGYIWAITDSSGSTSGPTGGFSGASSNTKSPGMILRLTYKNLNILPVNFISFNGRLTPEKNIELNWNAQVDATHRYFEIEKSFDGNNFFSIGKNYVQPYKFLDLHPAIGNNYYRIKSVDADNHFIYSRVINIIFADAIVSVSAYPNPVNHFLNVRINGNVSGIFKLTVTDLLGQKIFVKDISLNSSANDVTINTSKWHDGVYILKVTNSDHQTIDVQKLVKQE